MPESQEAFPSRLLNLRSSGLEALDDVSPPRPDRINQHIEGADAPTRAMTDAEVEVLLQDPMATLVLRQGVFPASLTGIQDALDAHNDEAAGLPEVTSFLISEGGQIPFADGLDKGGSRLITVRSRNGEPHLMTSTLVPPGVDPRSEDLLNEVIAWDPTNETTHFYQRQNQSWFWCGQSDMALVEPTRGRGAFDSHINGYVLMKELKTPWVHWHGPGLRIDEPAFAASDPLLSDPLFVGRETADRFEFSVIRPLADRWNKARFRKAVSNGELATFDQYARQLAGSTTANLVSSHREWAQIDAVDPNNQDLPATFFFDVDTIVDKVGLPVAVPELTLPTAAYKAAVAKHGLRVRDQGVDLEGDVPFCFTVPERAHEDVLAVQILIDEGVLSRRLAASVLMVDFANPVESPKRSSLASLFPSSVGVGAPDVLDEFVISAARGVPEAGDPESGAGQLLANWDLGPDNWEASLTARATTYWGAVVSRLASEDGFEAIFRLAESRRREFRQRPLAEFGLSLPQATNIPESAPLLAMDANANVHERKD